MNLQLSWKGHAIETEKLTKFYGSNRGVLDLDMAVEQEEIYGFLGPNGAGKTTTIRLLMDLIRPTAGHASLFGMDVQKESVAIKKVTGYLPGELALWDNLTGRQILTYLGNLRGGIPPARIEGLAERLDLDLGRKFREYSKGNKQKVGLIQAFMHEPRLMILDEPTAGLDPLNQQEFFLMAAEARARGATIFLSSHILSEVEHTCDRVGIISEGRLMRTGTVREVVTEKHYHVEMVFGVPVDQEIVQAFSTLPEVSEVEVVADDNMMRFVVHGLLDQVIKAAARYPVVSLTSHEPTLEEAFLAYYGPGKSAGTSVNGDGAPSIPSPEQEKAEEEKGAAHVG